MTNNEAIEILKGAIKKPNTKDGYLGQALTMGIEALENQKTGHWIKHENPNLGQCMKISYECSNCKVWLGCEYFVRKSYCPNCGAKMKGESNAE